MCEVLVVEKEREDLYRVFCPEDAGSTCEYLIIYNDRAGKE